MKSGVYRIVNLVNGKCYIGSSVNIRTRWNRHRYHLRKGRHPNPHLQNSWNKYGENNFKFEIIHLCARDKTIENEQFFLDKLNPEYNIAIDALAPALGMTGENCPSYGKRPHNYGKHLSEETKRKLSEAQMGENNYWYGRRHTDETKQKMSEAQNGKNNSFYGKKHTKEARLKMSKARKGENHWNYGKHLPEEQKQKISVALKGKNNPNWIQFSDRDIQEMKALRNTGVTYIDIANKFGVSESTVWKRINNTLL